VQHPQGKFSNIKTAAAGLHGFSDAFRGTLNSSIDRRTGASPAIVAAHEQVAERGRRELEVARAQAARERELRQQREREREQREGVQQQHVQQQVQQPQWGMDAVGEKERKKAGMRNVLRKSREGLRQ